MQERVSGAKLLQKVSGLKPVIMWITALAWDWMWLFVIQIIMILTLACFQESTMATPQELGLCNQPFLSNIFFMLYRVTVIIYEFSHLTIKFLFQTFRY